MLQKYFELLKLTPIYSIYRIFQQRKTYEQWEKEGIPIPPPSVVKQHIVKKYAKKFECNMLIETGTYLGEIVLATKSIFNRIISIEIDKILADKIHKKFSGLDNITIINGDSGKILGEILADIDCRCLFWLDSHYSGGLTSKGEIETPVMEELNHIFNHSIRDHVILIDDARCFTGENDYPEMNKLHDFVLTKRPDWSFEVEHDIIRIHKDDTKKIQAT